MSSHLKDPFADEYIAERAHQKRGHNVTYSLVMLLVKLDVWPKGEYEDRVVPLSPRNIAWKQFYKDKRKV